VYLVAEKVLKAASVNVLSPVIAVDQFYTVRFHISILNGVQEIPRPPNDSNTLKSKVEDLKIASNNANEEFLNPCTTV